MSTVIPTLRILVPLAMLSVACGGRPVTSLDSGGGSSGGGGGGGASSGSLTGTWLRTVSQDGITQEVQLIFESGGACEFILDIPDFGEYPIACTYTTSGSDLEIQDDECEADGYSSGTYEYSIASSVLTLSAYSDDCPTRGSMMSGEWTSSDS